MGLLERTNAVRRGLLSAAEGILLQDDAAQDCGETFGQLCKRCGFLHAGLFRLTDGMLVMRHAYAVNAVTVARSIATKSFWSGTVAQENQWYQPDGFGFEDFYQLFDSDLADSVTEAAFLRFSIRGEQAVFAAYAVNGEKMPELPPNIGEFCSSLERVSRNQPLSSVEVPKEFDGETAGLYLLPMAVALDKSVEGIDLISGEIEAAVKAAIFDEMVSVMQDGIASPNIISFNDEREFKIAMFQPYELNDQLFCEHVKFAFQPLIGEAAKYISFMPAGTCRNEKGISDFVLRS